MTITTMAWLAMAAYAFHILEEYSFDWRNWARGVLGLPVEWSDFFVTNAVVVALGIAQAALADTLPLAALSFAWLMLINAVFFHIMPFIVKKGRFSPGLITAVVLFIPLSVFMIVKTLPIVGAGTAVAGFAVGAVTMAFPIVMLKLRSTPFFDQTSPSN